MVSVLSEFLVQSDTADELCLQLCEVDELQATKRSQKQYFKRYLRIKGGTNRSPEPREIQEGVFEIGDAIYRRPDSSVLRHGT